MIIDARNLNQNARQNKALPTVEREQARELFRLLDKKHTAPNNEGMEITEPLSSAAKGSLTDALDLSKTGYTNLKETKLEFAFDMEYTKDAALTNAWLSGLIFLQKDWYYDTGSDQGFAYQVKAIHPYLCTAQTPPPVRNKLRKGGGVSHNRLLPIIL